MGRIKFKSCGKIAHLCSFCDGLWFDDESISETTGHSLRTYLSGMICEYEELDQQDQDHRPIHTVRIL